MEKAMWELRDDMHARYPSLFESLGESIKVTNPKLTLIG